jgi:hypothetical protein
MQTYDYAHRDKRRSEPEGEVLGLNAGHVVRHVALVRENPEMRHHKPESHQRDARANPGEKRSLFREVIPQISDRPSFDGGIHFGEANCGTHCGSIRCRRQAAFELDRAAAILKEDHEQVLQMIWQARASRAIGRATRRSSAQYTRHTGNDLVSIALTGSVLRLNTAASNPPRLSIYARCSACAEDAARTSLFRLDCVELFQRPRNCR